MNSWETIIGLEVHVQLATKSKMFSGSSTLFGAAPNTQADLVDLAMPGTLPVVNYEAIRMAVLFGLAIEGRINKRSQFVRKNYFYPDLPKGYQISQLDSPIVENGRIRIEAPDGDKWITIVRAHLEEDAGKSFHEDFHGLSGIDFNRAGTPLIEIVSAPQLNSAQAAVSYLKAIHTLVKYLEISDGDMSQGSMRCDANVSVRRQGETSLGNRAEIKNVNSFRFIEKALEYEVTRQIALIQRGGTVIQETRLYDAEKNETRSMRSKEEAHDYRYFPDPDLLPVELSDQWIENVRQIMVELPDAKRARFMRELALNREEATALASNKRLADFYERTLRSCKQPKLASSWVLSELLGALNKEGLDIGQSPLSAERLGGLLTYIADQTISGKMAKNIFQQLWRDPHKTAARIIEEQGLRQMTDPRDLERILERVLRANPDQLDQYRAGKDKLFGYFVGQMMKATQGRAAPQQLNALLKRRLGEK